MSSVTEYLHELNINHYNTLENYIFNTDLNTLYHLILYLRTLIDKDFIQHPYSPYSLIPSDELSGSGGCYELSCKTRRATNFANFSAIYADVIYIKLQSITHEHFDTIELSEIITDSLLEFNFRYELLCDINIINIYTPLIEKKLATIEPTRKSYCKSCFQKALLKIDNPIDIEPIQKYVREKVVIKILDNEVQNGSLTVRFENVDDFFTEETGVFMLNENFLRLMPSSYQYTDVLDKTLPCVSDLLSEIVEGNFVDSCYYAAYCKNNNAKLITSTPANAMFLQFAHEPIIEDTLNTLSSLPEYLLPFTNNIDLTTALHLREIEGESFNKYRIAFNNAINEQCKTNNNTHWQKIYDDIVYPEFCNLNLKLKNIKSGAFKKTFNNILLTSAVISAGVLSGVISKNFTSILAALGGSTGLIGLGNKVLDQNPPVKEQLRDNDYYFLWKLQKNK